MNHRFLSITLSLMILPALFGGSGTFAAPGNTKSGSHKPGVKPLHEIRKAEKEKKPQQTPGNKPQEERARKVKERNNKKNDRDRKQRKSGEHRKKEMKQRENINRGGKNASQR